MSDVHALVPSGWGWLTDCLSCVHACMSVCLTCRHAVDLKVDNLLLYPDFDHNFDLFEPLRSMQVGARCDVAWLRARV